MGDEPSTQQVPASPRFGILGPLQVPDAGHRPVPLGGPRARELLALLLLNPNRPLSSEHLVTAMWGESPSDGAATTLRTHVAAVRRVLASAGAGDALGTRAGGYLLALDPADLDAEVFAGLVDRGQEALGIGDPAHAAALLGEALALWRGDVLSDLGPPDFADAAVARLGELRVVAEETAMAAALALGQHREVVGRLQELVAAHPFHERLCGQLMLALYRSGRQVDALSAYAEAKQRLDDELGLDPEPRPPGPRDGSAPPGPGAAALRRRHHPGHRGRPQPTRASGTTRPAAPRCRVRGAQAVRHGRPGRRARDDDARLAGGTRRWRGGWSRWAGPPVWASRDSRPSWPTWRPRTARTVLIGRCDAAVPYAALASALAGSTAAQQLAAGAPPGVRARLHPLLPLEPDTEIEPQGPVTPNIARPSCARWNGCSPPWRRRPRCCWSSRTPSG